MVTSCISIHPCVVLSQFSHIRGSECHGIPSLTRRRDAIDIIWDAFCFNQSIVPFHQKIHAPSLFLCCDYVSKSVNF
ncbi:hypothetical protein ACB092_10G179500 [Castanea dentata]